MVKKVEENVKKVQDIIGGEVVEEVAEVSTEMVVKNDNPVAAQDDVVAAFGGQLEQDMIIIPRAKVLQPTSTEVASDPSLRPGMIVESLGLSPLPSTFIPIRCEHNYILFNPDPNDPVAGKYNDPTQEVGAILWRTTTPTPVQKQICSFGPNGEKPVGSETLDFLCLFTNQPVPCWLSFSKTSFMAGRRLYTQLAGFASQNIPMYSRVFAVNTKHIKMTNKSYFELVTKYERGATAQEMATAKKFLSVKSN